MKALHLTILLYFGLSISIEGQEKLKWVNKDLIAAQQIAAMENKLVFVDTYTNSCPPCKVMDIELRNSKLISYFNKNFINVKIDMNSPYGNSIKLKYELVFLPTLMILDSDGNVRYKVDEIIPAKELLYKSKLVREQNMSLSDASEISFTPVPSSAKIRKNKANLPAVDKNVENIEPDDIASEEKILFVLDGNNGEVPPPVLKQEAYHRLTLGDNSHIKAARNYLATQSDWSTKENIRFIFDFLGDTRDTLFMYAIQNKERFNEVVSKEQVDRTINILVNDRLQRGFPRPDLTECKYLFSLIHPFDYEILAYRYRLAILDDDKMYQDYLNLAQYYLQSVNTEDHLILANSGKIFILAEIRSNELLHQQITWLKKAINLSKSNPIYFQTLAHLYYLDNNKDMAVQSLSASKKHAKEKGITLSNTKDLERKIKAL